MLTKKNFNKILSFLDKEYWDRKVDETNWEYFGLTLDYYFDNSVLSIDYLDIIDYFDENGGFEFVESEFLVEQYREIPEHRFLKLIENLMNIINRSQVEKERNSHIINLITKVLQRQHINVLSLESGDLVLMLNHILDSGSYCNIIRKSDGILNKELKEELKNDEKLKKRMKYEFENMKKLSDSPYILNVFEFDEVTSSYLMEQADMNLLVYLSKQIELSLNEKLKIIFDILKGLKFAHENSIIHRDLHLGNILKIKNDFVISDFGLSKDTSIVKSLKSSYTEKNNHIFVDPLAINDFTKLDKKSDIYSVGKIIDYIFNYNSIDTNHILKNIVERCTSRDKNNRYDSVEEIIRDIELVLKYNGTKQDRFEIVNKIINKAYDSTIHDFIMEINNSGNLCKFIVEYELDDFGELLLKFDHVYQIQLIKTIEADFSKATGYGGWQNYDIFAKISYFICINTEDSQINNISYSILEECAKIRYYAQNLIERLPL